MAGFLCRDREMEIEKVIHDDVLFETPDIYFKGLARMDTDYRSRRCTIVRA